MTHAELRAAVAELVEDELRHGRVPLWEDALAAAMRALYAKAEEPPEWADPLAARNDRLPEYRPL